jgi:hypothetical protein
MNKKLIKIAIIIFIFALGMFVNKIISIQNTPKQIIGTVSERKPNQVAVEISTDPKDYKCHRIERLGAGNYLTFCVGKKAIEMEPGKLYVKGQTHRTPTSTTVFIDKNLDHCGIIHELGHVYGMNEDQAYDLTKVCYELIIKGVWKFN